ncbi:MAG: hypothetical protein K2Q22_12955, partial [Cytophagales bacterium]|nr:hypothetical protein [Cytophagales bacterium]
IILQGMLFLYLLYESAEFKEIIRRYLIFGFISIFTVLVLYFLSNVSLIDIYSTTKQHMNGNFGGEETFLGIGNIEWNSYLSIFSIMNGTLFVMGIIISSKNKNYKPLIIFITSFIPLFIFYFGNISTPKYLFYGIIPIIILVSEAWKIIIKSRIWTTGILLLFILQYLLFGLKAYNNSGKLAISIGDFILIGNKTTIREKLTPYLIQTADGKRLSSGIICMPLLWYSKSKEQNKVYTDLSQSIFSNSELYTNKIVCIDENETAVLLFNILINNKFYPIFNKENIFTFKKEKKQITLEIINKDKLPRNAHFIFKNVYMNIYSQND